MSHPDVHIGRNGWLFLIGGRNRVISQYRRNVACGGKFDVRATLAARLREKRRPLLLFVGRRCTFYFDRIAARLAYTYHASPRRPYRPRRLAFSRRRAQPCRQSLSAQSTHVVASATLAPPH